MIATSTDYSERQLDLEVLQSVTAPASATAKQVHLTSVGAPPKFVTGAQKAMQRYAVLLLTGLGDLRFDPTVGGELVTELASGNMQNLGYLYHVFAVANANALRVLAADDADPVYGTTPDDERILTATLLNVALDYDTGTVSLEVQIATAAASGYVFVIPVNTMR